MRFVVVAIQMLLLALPLAAEDPLSAFLDAKSLRTIRSGSTMRSSVPADGTLKLIPSLASRDRISAAAVRMQPTVGVEVLRVMSVPPDSLDASTGLLKLFNAMHAVSTMQGIPYYSATRGRAMVLFTQSYAVESAESLQRIPDPVFTDVPAEDVLITFQNDTSFGRNAFREVFWRGPDHLAVRIENLTRISMLLFPFAEPGNMVTEVALVPRGSDLLFYGVACLRTTMPIGDRRSREDSLANRMIAIADWLKTRLAPSPK
jgi:hypothetical protein